MIGLLRLILPHHWVWACLSDTARRRQEALNQVSRAWDLADLDPAEAAALKPWIWGTVLEVGAGDGTMTRHLVGWATAVTALEPDTARCWRGKAAVPKVLWRQASWQEWPHYTYDRVVMSHTLHHLANRPAVSAWVRQRLEVGGQWLLLEPRHTWKRVLRLTAKWLRYWCWKPWRVYGATHDFLTDAEVRTLATAGGFTIVHRQPCTHATLWVLQRG